MRSEIWSGILAPLIVYGNAVLSLEISKAMPYVTSMHTVISTPEFLSQAKNCGLTQGEIDEIVQFIAEFPESGDVIAGTGAARKLRHAGRGKGKSGGYRTIHYWGGGDIPVFLLAVYGKGQRSNLSKAERNALAKILPKIGDAYRKSTKLNASKSK